MKSSIISCIKIASLCAAAFCCTKVSAEQKDLPKRTGFVAFENGQIGKGMSPTSDNLSMDHGWLERVLTQFSHEFNPTDKTKFIMAIEAQLGFTYPQNLSDRSTYLSRFWLYPARIEGMYSLGEKESPFFQIGFGYFPYQDNKSVRNLGEFLFRSGTYPPFLVNNFNQPFTRLLGLRLSSTLWNSFEQDLLFTSEAQIYPTQDYSLSYVTHYTLARCLELGAGISFAHLFSINEQFTSPTIFKDPYTAAQARYIKENGDTAYYTFKGTKPDILLAFDPKPLLPSGLADMFGKEDGKLYGEACILGWKNYKNFSTDTTINYPDFHNRADRAVAMVGFNIPSFKQLDVLSCEFEYKSPVYTNSYKSVIVGNLPVPLTSSGRTLLAWKWSVYAKKTFLERFTLIGQVARDHMRPSVPLIIQAERDDVLFRPGDWWWVCRLMIKY